MIDDEKYFKHRLKRAREQRLVGLKNAFKTVDKFAECTLSPQDHNSYERIKKILIKEYSTK